MHKGQKESCALRVLEIGATTYVEPWKGSLTSWPPPTPRMHQSCLPFLSFRMIGLDKNPGIRPVGIGETFRRIVTVALIQNFRGETQNATVPIQTCGGARSGVEAAVHTMSGLFDDSTTECVLFVDADNAFNRQAALHKISFISPEISTFLNNVYKSPTPFYIKEHVSMSREGTTQGDANVFYCD